MLPPLFFYQAYEPALAAELLILGARASKALGMMVAAGLLALTIGVSLPAALIAGWLGLMLASSLIGAWFNARYRDREPPDLNADEVRRAEWMGVFYSTTVGIAWGSSSQLMIPGNEAHNLIVMIVFFGIGAAAGAVTIFNLARMLASLVLGVFIFVLPFPAVFPQEWPWLMVMVTAYNLFIVITTWQRNQVIVANLLLRKDKERLLAHQRAETARANKASQDKSAFLAAASHDLRQPLHALMLTSHALALRTPEGENRVLVQRIVEAGRALSEQFNHLMDLSRLESGTYRLKQSTVALPALMQQVLAAHRQVAEHKGIALRLRLDRRVQNLALDTDAGLLGRVLDNLTDNAIKFSDSGKAILLSARPRSGCIELRVHDQGIGIPAGEQQNIFKPYVQLNNPTRDLSRGIGLGLSIVHEAVALLGGTLSLRSQPGRGSCFGISLPAATSHPLRALAPAADESAARAAYAERLRGKRLLLIEDDPMAAAALRLWAQDLGLEVQHYTDPGEVPATARPDLILCDIRLPGERDGIAWLSEWLGHWPEARGLLLSGELAAETHQRAEQEGLLLLFKPAQPELLLKTLAGMV